MELYEVLNCYCNRNSGAVSKEDKRKYSYMLRRLFSAQFPIQCELVNRLDSDPLIDAELIAMLAMRFNGLPSFLKTRIDQKKKKETIRTYYEDEVLNKYMEINECGIREVEEAYAINKTELDNALKLIKFNFFNNKEKVIVNKNTDKVLIMEVNTKFNINETVWVVSDNKVIQQKVRGIEISVEKKVITITYSLLDDSKYTETELYKTKQELIDAL